MMSDEQRAKLDASTESWGEHLQRQTTQLHERRDQGMAPVHERVNDFEVYFKAMTKHTKRSIADLAATVTHMRDTLRPAGGADTTPMATAARLFGDTPYHTAQPPPSPDAVSWAPPAAAESVRAAPSSSPQPASMQVSPSMPQARFRGGASESHAHSPAPSASASAANNVP